MALHPVVRRTLVLLSSAYVLSWTSVAMVAGPGSAAFVELSGRRSDAGLFFALFGLAAAVGALAGGRAMDRFGRRGVLVAADLLAAAGFAAAGFGILRASLALFVAGVAALAFGNGALGLTRVAVAEMFPASGRGRAVGWLQVSVTVGAVLGPLLLVAAGPLSRLLGRDPASTVWFFAPPLLLAAAVLVARAGEPSAIARELHLYHDAALDLTPPPAPGPIPPRPFVASVAALALAQCAMVAVMGVAGTEILGAGHGLGTLGIAMLLHFLGMFSLSTVVGRLADRIGRRATMAAGLVLLAAGGFAVALLPGVAAFAVGLFVIGLGWSFAFLGATVLLTDIVPVARRGRVIGRVDLVASLLSAAVAAAGGWWYATNGLPGLGLAAAALVVLPLILVSMLPASATGSATPGAAASPAPDAGSREQSP